MSEYVTASSKFPFLNKWKKISRENILLDVVDNMLSGFAQIAFNDNSFAGILMIIGTFIASPEQAISGVWAVFIATITARFLGVSIELIRTGLYGFNAALSGLAIPALIFPGDQITFPLLIYSGIAGIFSVVLTVGIAGFLSKWNVPFLAMPYSLTLLVFVPASLSLGNLNITREAPVIFEMISANAEETWTILEFITASLNGMAQVLWIESPVTGLFYLAAVLIASRIDLLSTLAGAIIATGTAILLGMPKDLITAGIYGFNAVLIMKVITRGFLINIKSITLGVILSVLTVILSAALRVIFAPIGAVASFAFPYAILAIVTFMGRDMLKGLTYIPNTKWGVPETIRTVHEESIKED